jgi:polar amino acid transport system substrate-binding protein
MHLKISVKRQCAALKGWLLVPICLVGLFCTEFTLAAGQPFVMSTSVRPPLYSNDGSGYLNLLTTEIFRRLEINYQLIHLPEQRALIFANNKTVDGTGPRTAAIEEKFPNLIRVPVNVLDFDFMAYSKNRAINISGWESLNPYSVGFINGWKIVEHNTTNAKLVTKATDYDQLFRLLEKGRIDIAILDREMGGWQLRQLGFDLHAIEPPIITKPNFLYLHKEHANLVPQITRVLVEMQQDGSMDAIRSRGLPGFSRQ